jgi:hypothetical protein
MADGDDLELIPRGVRVKLDTVGIKLHLREWQVLVQAEREWLRDTPCMEPQEVDRYRRYLDELILKRTGRPPDRVGKHSG